MTPPRNPDRDAILSRRALFISTALAGLACTTPKPNADTGERPVARAEDGDDARPPETPPETPQLAPNAPWAEVMAAAPPLDVPEGLSERERQHLITQKTNLEREYEQLRSAWERVPECPAGEEGCAVWAEIAKILEPMYDERFVGGCESAVGWTGTVSARAAAHERYMHDVVARLETYLTGASRHHGRASATSWQSILAQARAPKPMPCLSACARPPVTDVLTIIPFAEDSAALRIDDAAVELQLDSTKLEAQANGGAKLVVRGHADPSEQDGEALAKQRAQAVADWLIAAGVPKDRIEVVGLGARLNIARGTAGLGANPRVDFEAVPAELNPGRGG